MSKIDLKNAFRLILVRPEDWNLLGVRWHNRFLVGHMPTIWPQVCPLSFQSTFDCHPLDFIAFVWHSTSASLFG